MQPTVKLNFLLNGKNLDRITIIFCWYRCKKLSNIFKEIVLTSNVGVGNRFTFKTSKEHVKLFYDFTFAFACALNTDGIKCFYTILVGQTSQQAIFVQGE